MWKLLPYSKPLFLSCTTENRYRIYITDYMNIWWAVYNESELLNILKKSNDDLEMESDTEFLQLGLKMLLEPEKLKKLDLNFEDNVLNISMMMSHTFPVYLELKLTEGSREMFFKNITQQLLKTVQDLKTSENELRFLLLKKDKEIEEYKNETDVRLAMYLKTGVYRDEEHMEKHPMYECHFGTSEVSKCLLERIKDDTEDQVAKQENQQIEEQRIKDELDSQPFVKNETNIESETQNISNSVKREIKNECGNFISPKKRARKMFKI